MSIIFCGECCIKIEEIPEEFSASDDGVVFWKRRVRPSRIQNMRMGPAYSIQLISRIRSVVCIMMGIGVNFGFGQAVRQTHYRRGN